MRQLEGLGHDPADVRHIITTHLDLDHAGGIGDFPEVQDLFASGARRSRRARRDCWSVPATSAQQPGENPSTRVEYEAGGDDWYGFESIRLLPDLDGEIALIPLPGHTAGHCGVAVNTADGWLLHCGDAFFFHGEIERPPRCPPGLRMFQNLNQHDGKARHRNQERLRDLQREHGDEVTLICSHDAEMLQATD